MIEEFTFGERKNSHEQHVICEISSTLTNFKHL
jgi:hypothetical protein